MGYAVFEDRFARDYGVRRWAGYGVPGECDTPDCSEEVYRGFSARCEVHIIWDGDAEVTLEGCNLFFCSKHRSDTDDHEKATPKPDSINWIYWQLHEGSWEPWRTKNPELVTEIQERLAKATPEEIATAAAFLKEETDESPDFE